VSDWSGIDSFVGQGLGAAGVLLSSFTFSIIVGSGLIVLICVDPPAV